MRIQVKMGGCLAGLTTYLLLISTSPLAAQPPATGHEPSVKVRAVTAFVRVDRAQFDRQISQSLEVLRSARRELENAGYEVQRLRITTQPFLEYAGDLSPAEALKFFQAFDQRAKAEGFIVSLGPTIVRDEDDSAKVELAAAILNSTENMNTSIVVAENGRVYPRACRAAARLKLLLSRGSPHSSSTSKFCAAANVPEFTPFFPGSNHRGPGMKFAFALQSAGVVARVAHETRDKSQASNRIAAALEEALTPLERMGEAVARKSGWGFAGIDVSPAPLKEESIAAAVEDISGGKIGAGGTLSAVAAITSALKGLKIKKCGYSGLMLPVMEDSLLAQRSDSGLLSVPDLLFYSAVCGTGIDTVPVPGEVTVEQLEKVIEDMATLAVKLSKPLSARLMPIAGKKAGEMTEFNHPFFVNVKILPLK